MPPKPLPVLEDDPLDRGDRVLATLTRFYNRLERRMAAALADHGLTVAQADVLATLSATDGISQQELAELRLVTKGNIVGLVDRLGAAGWVERRPDSEDRRINRLHLTPAGREALGAALPRLIVLRREIFGVLDEPELRQLHALLRKLDEACG